MDITYRQEWTEDFDGQSGWLATFEDGVMTFVSDNLTNDPELVDTMHRDAYEDFHLGYDAPTFRVYPVPHNELPENEE